MTASGKRGPPDMKFRPVIAPFQARMADCRKIPLGASQFFVQPGVKVSGIREI